MHGTCIKILNKLLQHVSVHSTIFRETTMPVLKETNAAAKLLLIGTLVCSSFVVDADCM